MQTKIQITRASVFTTSNKRVRALAKELKLTLPECWDKLLNFGEDAIKRQEILLGRAEAPSGK